MTAAIDSRSARARLPRAGEATGRVLAVAAALIAFWVAFSGVRMLEDHEDTTHAVVRFVLATLLLIAAGLRAPAAGGAAHSSPEGTRAPASAPDSALRITRAVESALWWALPVVAVLLAVAFRLNEIRTLPYGIWFDEAQNGLVARRILDGDHPIFISGQTQLPALAFYAFAASLKILGDNITSLRAVTTLAGTLNVIFVYLLARELFDRRVGALAAFFLAVMRWHVNFSRLAMHGIFAPLFMVATFYLLVRGLRGKGLWNFAVAGVMLGIGLQTYYSFVLVPVVIALYLVHHAISERVLGWSRLANGLRIFALAAIIVYAPLGDWAIHHWDQFNQRTDTASITKNRSTSEALHVAFTSAKKHLLMFSSKGDRNGRHNIPGAPMLDTVTGFLFVLGVGYAFWRIRSSSYFLLLIWAAITLQSGIWSVEFEAPQAYRTVAITPAIAMLAALPLARLWRVASAAAHDPPAGGDGPRRSWTRPGVVAAARVGVAATVTVVLLTAAARQNFHDYFDVQLNDPEVWRAYNTDITLATKEMAAAEGSHKILISSLFSSPVIDFLDPAATDRPQRQLDLLRDVPVGDSRPTLVLLDATKLPYAKWIMALYPGAEVTTIAPPGPHQDPLVYKVLIPQGAVRDLHGLQVSYSHQGDVPLAGREAALDHDWSSQPPPVQFPFHARWSGTLRIADFKSRVLSVIAPGSVTLRIDGREVGSGNGRVDYAATMYRGLHTISVEADVVGPGRVALLDEDKPVAAGNLFSGTTIETRHGLIGTFFQGDSFSGDPLLQELDPFVGFRYHAELSFGSPFSTTWKGHLDVPAADTYTFSLDPIEEGSLLIDGHTIMDFPGTGESATALTAGAHDIEIRFKNRGGYAAIYLRWSRAGGEREVVPSELLTP